MFFLFEKDCNLLTCPKHKTQPDLENGMKLLSVHNVCHYLTYGQALVFFSIGAKCYRRGGGGSDHMAESVRANLALYPPPDPVCLSHVRRY